MGNTAQEKIMEKYGKKWKEGEEMTWQPSKDPPRKSRELRQDKGIRAAANWLLPCAVSDLSAVLCTGRHPVLHRIHRSSSLPVMEKKKTGYISVVELSKLSTCLMPGCWREIIGTGGLFCCVMISWLLLAIFFLSSWRNVEGGLLCPGHFVCLYKYVFKSQLVW